MRVFALALCLAPATALAWEAKCYQPDGEGCTEGQSGPVAGRSSWNGEHGILAQTVFARYGFPEALQQSRSLVTYTEGGQIQSAGSADPAVPDCLSLIPADAPDVKKRLARQMQIAQFAELPDMAFSMGDYLTGEETCPIEGSDANPIKCHVYAVDFGSLSLGTIAPINSTHFSPQAGALHAHYHAAALIQAGLCREMEDALGDRAEDPLMLPYLEECDWLALSIEAVGQHYLQDVWSSGHMWPRWGGPYLNDVGGQVQGGIVGAISGLIHGAKSLLPFADDPLCFPTEFVEWRQPGGPRQRGVGDLYVDMLLGDPTFRQAQQDLMDCSAANFGEVYRAGAEAFGPAPATEGLSHFGGDPTCYTPRATNLAMYEGFGVTIQGVHLTLDPITAAFLTLIGFGTGLEDDMRADATSLAFRINLAALAMPFETTMASNRGGALGNMLGIAPNDRFLDHIPASWHDAAPPYDKDSPYGRVFVKAHAKSWCEEGTLTEIGRLAAACADEEVAHSDTEPNDATCPDDATDEDTEPAACALCETLASMRFRNGCSADDPALVDAVDAVDGICRYVLDPPESGQYLYLPLDAAAGETAEQRIRAYCHGTSRTNICDNLLVTDRVGGRLLGLKPGDGYAVDFLIPVGARPQQVAISANGAPIAVVASETEGSVALVDLANGLEIDQDDDPDTTDAGAPSGITRIPLPGARGVAVTPDGRHAVVASYTTNVVGVIDILSRRLVALVAMPDDQMDSVAINDTATKAYVTLTGTIAAPDNRIAVVPLQNVLDDDNSNDAVTLIEHVGGSSRPTRMSVAPDGTTVAVTLPSVNRVAWLDMVTDEIIDLEPDRPEALMILLDYPPMDVAFSPDGAALYVLEVSAEAGAGGSLRRVANGTTRLGPPTPTGSSPRALALSADGQRAYVANGDNTITVIAPEGESVLATIDLAGLFLNITPGDLQTW